MKTSRNGLKPIPEKEMPEWAPVASRAHKRATKKTRFNLSLDPEIALSYHE
jgi:hypothetical protein